LRRAPGLPTPAPRRPGTAVKNGRFVAPMWKLKEPNPIKIIVGILASDEHCLAAGRKAVAREFGPLDLTSDIWPFDQTAYYRDQTGLAILRQFVSIEPLADPGVLAEIKHRTNRLERELAEAPRRWPGRFRDRSISIPDSSSRPNLSWPQPRTTPTASTSARKCTPR